MDMKKLEDLANGLICGMFASRDTVGEAYEYASSVAESFRNSERALIYTAIHVLMNAIADQIKNNIREAAK